MNEDLIARLGSDDEEASADFGESENCVVVDTHPTVLEKYFLSAERLEAYMKKSYLLRLFSKP